MANFIKIDSVDCGSHDGHNYEIEVTTAEGRRFHFVSEPLSASSADRLVDRIRRAGKIRPEYWNEGYPVYGSPAFLGEEALAHHWANRIRNGSCELADVPSSVRSLI